MRNDPLFLEIWRKNVDGGSFRRRGGHPSSSTCSPKKKTDEEDEFDSSFKLRNGREVKNGKEFLLPETVAAFRATLEEIAES
ncbi:hypothetical protein PanWU01x14_191920 [Parasponia andersonii]|uniref:Uncharacterized protein n=1 Tax=Parasponia andersonii TaxID=3476 RepID=A0A2P5C1Q4_PARAD|nr:hypothetical protein PanWU01x14_191920 [Parasponia andersonii]